VSASAAVLDQLASHGLVLVSSHNLVLATLLTHRLVPLRVIAPDGDKSCLVLEPGVLVQTNGIALLGAGGFGADLEANAARVFDWLSEHLAQPGEGAHLLYSPWLSACTVAALAGGSIPEGRVSADIGILGVHDEKLVRNRMATKPA